MTSRSQYGSLTQRAKDNLFSNRPSSIGGAGAAIIGTQYQPSPQYQPSNIQQHSSTHSAPFGTSPAYNSYANQSSQYLSSARSQSSGYNNNANNNQTFSVASISARPQNAVETYINCSPDQLASPLTSTTDPLQLEHIIGYVGLYTSLVVPIPNHQYLCAKGISNMVVLDNLLDPHQQQFLLGHDMPVTCLKGSTSGRFLISGQEGTIHHKGYSSPIFAWDLSRVSSGDSILGVFKGLTERVSHCSLSPDDRFVIGCGQDCLLYIWDLMSGDMIYGQRMQHPVSVLEWGEVKANGHEYSYEFFFTQGKNGNGNLYQGVLTYESLRMQWNLTIKPFQYMLSSGINRSILCITLSKCNQFIYCGTSSGEALIFRRDTLVFRLNLPLCSGGLKGILSLNNGEEMICSGGDGNLVRLRGYDMKWEKIEESKVDSSIESLLLINNQTELFASTVSGNSFLISSRNLNQIKLLTASHTNNITCLSFPKYLSINNTNNENPNLNIFTTGSSNSELRVWDLNNYSCLSVIKNTKFGSVTSLCMIDSRTILSGWSNGTLLCSDIYGRGLWTIPSAHRDGVLAIDFCDENLTLLNSPNGITPNRNSNLQYIATGGGEGTIRIWKPNTRELITEYIEHSKPISSLKIDSFRFYYIHSTGKEGNIVTYDIKNNKKIALHTNAASKSSLLYPNSAAGKSTAMSLLNNLTQKLYENGEIVTVDAKGKIFSWDIDYIDPVINLQDPSNKDLICCAMSPVQPNNRNSGTYLAYGGEDGIIRIIDMKTNQMISYRTNGSGSPIRSLAFTPDGQQLVAVSDDSTISIWNLFLN